MKRFSVQSFSDEAALASAVATQWLDRLSKRDSSAIYRVALSGGRIARRFLSNVAEQSRTRGFNFENVHFFWSDERCVPPSDPESNFAAANSALLQPLAIALDQIHRIRGELSSEKAVAEAEAELRRFAKANDPGEALFEMVFLGMGEDGHVASLFPNEPEKSSAEGNIYRAVVASKPPPQRITLDYEPISTARAVWAIASGKGKEWALSESLRPDGKTPLATLLRRREHTVIFTDILLPSEVRAP